VKLERTRQGRDPQASAGAIDSQSVKVVAFLDEDTGIDGGKKIHGRKRHLLVDTLGLPLAVHVSAANTALPAAGRRLPSALSIPYLWVILLLKSYFISWQQKNIGFT